ncbi:WD40 repeat-like protein [Piromyces finnis]|uniref:WD40 repeat-like protein n=1 Tax=Piromyces finnis TaxID=1754191 RepID=A0A1Y1VB34_9FUNG|nr:WD40 repeat-like protein [Piromyces finnis]|eukprot:ORX51762.1 WD40 repeat-like protein [Piromyces finnis]
MSLLKVFTRKLSKKNFQKAELSELWRYGLSNQNGLIAADIAQKLLAIGTNKGINLIRFPRNESEEIRETFLYLAQEKSKINFLKFKTGGEYLISIYDNEELVIWDVNERTVHLQVKLSINVTCIDFYPDSNWLFLGSDNGCVYIYDVVNGILSSQNILCKTKSGEAIPSSVQCIAVNPIKNRILIGFEYGLIIQYHIKKQKIIERYQQEEILTSVQWCPDGIHFITGTNKGSLCFWKTGKTIKPLVIKNVRDYTSQLTEKLNNIKEEGEEEGENQPSLELINPIDKIKWIQIEKNKTQIICSEKSLLQTTTSNITIITLQNVEFGSPLSMKKIVVDEEVKNFDIIPYENQLVLVTLSDNNCRFFNLTDSKEIDSIYNSLFLLKLPDIVRAIQTQFTKDFVTSFVSEEKYNESSQNILFNGYVTYHKDNILRYWLQTSYGFIFLESLPLPENIEIFDFLVSFDKTLIVYNNKFEIYSLEKDKSNCRDSIYPYSDSIHSTIKKTTFVKKGVVKLQKTKEFKSKIINFSYYKQMGISAVLTESKQLIIFSIYHDNGECIIDAETLLQNPITIDLLESNIDFPIIVIGNEKGQCMNYAVIQTEKEFILQPVQDSKFNVSSKILFIKSIPAMSINEIVENTISPVEVTNSTIDSDDNASPNGNSEKWNIKIHEKLYVVVTSSHIKVFKNKFSDLYDNLKLNYEPIFSEVVEIDGLKYCICMILNENLELYINIYSIPNLALYRVIKYPTNDLASFETLSITPTGLMIIWFKGNEFKQFYVWGREITVEEEDSQSSLIDLVSPYSAKSQSWSVDYDEALSYTIPKTRRTSIREIDTFLKKNLEISSPNKEICPINIESPSTKMFEDKSIFSFKQKIGLNKALSKSDSHFDKVKKENEPPMNSLEDKTKTTSNIYAQARENLEERGEHLEELDRQVSELNQGASEFLKSIREYNERMSKKKWYQL